MIRVPNSGRPAPGAPARFRPGDLVRHKRYGYRGVVVDLDLACRASDAWYRSNRTQPARAQPWYHVLVHGGTHATYAAQENLTAEWEAAPIEHPLLERYFTAFTGERYERNQRPWEFAQP